MIRTHSFRRVAIAAIGVGAVLVTAACSSNNSGGTASSAASSASWSQHGPINYVQGKDTSGQVQNWLNQWNSAHPSEKVTLVELSDNADAQRASMIQNHNNKGSSGYDVLSVDVVWTAEFAAKGVIQAMPTDQFSTTGYLPAAIDAATYFNKLYAFPATSDGAMLYYRKDLLDAVGIKTPPTTWDQMKADCKTVIAKNPGMTCYGGQFQKYEGLTCNIAEWINSAGGVFIDPNNKPAVNSAAALSGVSALVSAFKDGTISKDELTWQEEPSRNAFQQGKLVFLRNWPYVYSLAEKTDGSSKVAGKFAVAPIPGLTGPGVSTLGGHNMGVTTESKNLGTDKDFILWWNNLAQQKAHVIATSNAPTIVSLYTDADLDKQFPYLPVLQKSIQNAKGRPKAVQYGDVTSAIQDTTYSVITAAATGGSPDVSSAFGALQTKLTSLVSS